MTRYLKSWMPSFWPSLPKCMLSLLIYVAKDVVNMTSLPHVIGWEHRVEGGLAVTTKDRA